jgi:hypothetical protein
VSYACLMMYIEADATPERRVRLSASLADQFNAMLIGVCALAIPPPGPLYQVRSHPVMHLQIVEVKAQLTGRYVASAPHSWTMRIGPAESRGAGWN